jgi:hypothetical protein
VGVLAAVQSLQYAKGFGRGETVGVVSVSQIASLKWTFVQ